jgi:chlorobactene glucosyltransferase
MLAPHVLNVFYGLCVLGATYFLLLSLSNIVWLRLSSRKPHTTMGGKVSVLIPARNEEENLEKCLESLLVQTYTNYEVIVLDDQSTDHTWEIITHYVKRYPGLIRAVKGKPLPRDGWNGKPFAMQQLSEYANGDYFLFTDADTVHSRESIAWAVTNIESHGVDCLSGYVSQELNTFGEVLIVPATYIMTTIILPLWLIAATRAPGLSFAIGQFVMFKRQAYEAIGGYSSVSEHISDDIFVVRELKKAGFHLIFLDIRKYVRCQMYKGYRASFDGICKNIYDFFKNRPVFLTAALSALVFFVVLPLILLPLQLISGNPAVKLISVSVMIFLLAWALTLYDRGLKWWAPFLYPLLFLHLLYMAWRSFGRVATGQGVPWKGRVLR